MSDMKEKILKQAATYFDDKIDKFGSVSAGVGWNSLDAQKIRYRELSRIIDKENRFSVCDYGCGYGYYVQYLLENGFDFTYTGMDISRKMLEAARQNYAEMKERDINFIYGSDITDKYDYIVGSGIFNLRNNISDEDWLKYILDSLHQFNENSIKGFSFNCLTKYSDPDRMENTLYYADPLFLFDYCKRNFSKNVALLHDYQLYDFTILVRKGI